MKLKALRVYNSDLAHCLGVSKRYSVSRKIKFSSISSFQKEFLNVYFFERWLKSLVGFLFLDFAKRTLEN